MNNGFSALITLATVLLVAVSQPVFAEENELQTEDSSMSQLKINAEYIERLVLVDDSGKDYRFEDLSKPVMLPPGRYRLREVYLEGGFQSYHWSDAGLEWIEMGTDEEAILKIGPPLEQSIILARRGPVLKLDYKLTGQGGENYSSSDRENAPAFVIYKGDKQIASGKFEYG
jgi:hypothetical protein